MAALTEERETYMITIRDYVKSDAVSLWEIFYNTIRHINIRDYSQAEVEAWASDEQDQRLWEKRMSGINPFIAEIDGVVVGYTDLQTSGLIDHFFCHHEYQRQGVGKALMEHIFTIGELRGVKRYYSEVSKTAKPFYEQFGFSVVKEQTLDTGGLKLENFLMEKIS